MSRVRLSVEDRLFFGVLSKAIVMNPFGSERVTLMRELGSSEAGNAWSIDPHAYDLVMDVERRLEQIGRDGGRTLDRFADEDRALMQLIFLYQIYHRIVPEFDTFISTQLRDPNANRSVPFARETLAAIIRRGLDEDTALDSFAFAFQLRRAFFSIVTSIVGVSDCIRRLREHLWNCVFTFDLHRYQLSFIGRMEDFSTLLLGETGTGKGQAAAAIGRSGHIPFDPRSNQFAADFCTAFIATNLSCFPENLVESELFGHRKGAFTGAIRDHEGILERCCPHGSLFLDEIGDVSVAVQIKLLDVLHDRVFTRIGDHTQRRFQGRVIAATNRPLDQMRRDGRFRDDFFYRLASDVVEMPSLRLRIAESPEELPLLVSALVARTVDDPSGDLTGLVLDTLAKNLPAGYGWPGNVRELEQVVRSILMTGKYNGSPTAGDAEPEVALAHRLRAGDLTAEALLASYCALQYERIGTLEGVAQQVGLDRRTVKSYLAKHRLRDDAG